MVYAFEDFELDTRGYELRRAGESVPVEPQVFDVLVLLVRNRDRVVTKRELLDEVWGHRFVGESTMSSRIMTARKAVGDDGRSQRVIKTIHGRGFRFVADVEEVDPAEDVEAPPDPVATRAPAGWLDEALAGERRVVFVTGEAGLGKTTLLEAFLAGARVRAPEIGVARGQCLEHVGPGEPYGPVLEALGRLCREPDGEEAVALLERRAPTWLVQMPSIVDPETLEALRERTLGIKAMARELVEALEEWTAARPLVLALEDLHWSDPSTVDLIGWLARRAEPARLMVVATCRPGEARAADHPLEPLRRDLSIRSLSRTLELEPLDEAGVREIVADRVPGAEASAGLVDLVHRRSGGNPLFVTGLLDAWTAAGAIEPGGEGWKIDAPLEALADEVPETLRLLIEDRVERLERVDLELLSAAAVEGVEFSASTAGAAIGLEVGSAEARLEALARGGRFVASRSPVEWPDGTVSAGYAFTHPLYVQVLYDRIPPARRAQLHQRIGNRLEAAHRHRAVERTPELVVHFVRGGDLSRAVRYLRLAAERAMRRGAAREAIGHLREGLDLIRRREDLPGREKLEHGFLALLGSATLLTDGWAAPEAESAFARACEIGERLGEGDLLLPALYGLAVVKEYRAEYRRSQEIMEEVLDLADERSALRLQAHELLACSLFHQGAFADAVEQADRGLGCTDPERPAPENADFGDDSAMSCHAWAGLAAWFLGRPDEARERLETAVRMARAPDRAYCLANALSQAARVHQLRREPGPTRERAAEAKALAERHGFAYFGAVATVLHGWARAVEGDAGGVEEIERGIESHAATGATMDRPYFLGLLADGLAAVGRPVEGLAAVRRALETAGSSDRPFFYDAELARLEAELSRRVDDGGVGDRSEAGLREALRFARDRGDRGTELRAAVALARALAEDERPEEGRALLEPLVSGFSEGRECVDFREAAALLETV